jgi:hypothetical protein
VLEGKAVRKEEEGEEKPVEAASAKPDKTARRIPKVVDVDEELEDDALLGESTLAKMSAAREDTPAVETPAAKIEEQAPAAPEEANQAETKE